MRRHISASKHSVSVHFLVCKRNKLNKTTNVAYFILHSTT